MTLLLSSAGAADVVDGEWVEVVSEGRWHRFEA